MAGLVPAVPLRWAQSSDNRDARVEPAPDTSGEMRAQCFMHSASAVPATPMQVAASLSPILPICSVPPGQVAETRVSSGMQISSQRLWQATSCSARSPLGAGDPA
jgi:hypothetical protein